MVLCFSITCGVKIITSLIRDHFGWMTLCYSQDPPMFWFKEFLWMPDSRALLEVLLLRILLVLIICIIDGELMILRYVLTLIDGNLCSTSIEVNITYPDRKFICLFYTCVLVLNAYRNSIYWKWRRYWRTVGLECRWWSPTLQVSL